MFYLTTTYTVDHYCPDPACRKRWSVQFIHEPDVNCSYPEVEEDTFCPDCGADGVPDEPAYDPD